MSSTSTTDTTAVAAKPPKITFSPTCRSRSAPNCQSISPPKLMLTRFMIP